MTDFAPNILELVLWVSLGTVAYVYLIYPVLVAMLACLTSRRSSRDPGTMEDVFGKAIEHWPIVTLIIAAYREESVILQRLQNALLLDYPADRLEIIVGCDGREDLTGELARTCDDSRITVLEFEQRRGKASVLNDCVATARGEIVVLSDANTMMEPQSVRRLVRHFGNGRIGGACGKLILTDPLTGQNVDGVYWRYENFLKRCEAKCGVLLGFNGALYAIRKSLFQQLPAETLVDDFIVGMRIYLQGRNLVYDSTAVAREETPALISSEFQRRVRIGAGGFQSLRLLWRLLTPQHGRLAWAFWSHKVLRWVCPLFLLTAMAANLALASSSIYLQLLLLQASFYAIAACGLWWGACGRLAKPVRIAALFVSMNAALLVGAWRWIRGTQGAQWKRTERADEERACTEDIAVQSFQMATTLQEPEKVQV